MPARPPLPHVKHRIFALRKAMGLTQEELGTRSGLDRVYVNRLESGGNKASTVEMRRALAQGFQVSRDDMDDYLDGVLPLDEMLKRIGKAQVTPTPVSRSTSKTPRFDAAVDLLGDEIPGAVVREVRERAVGNDETKKTFEWALELVEASRHHIEALAAQAERFRR